MVSCRGPGHTNPANKSSNIAKLVITMLLQLYYSIFRTLVYLMPEAYPKPCQISKNDELYRDHCHSQNSLLEHFQGSLGIFSDTDAYSAPFRHCYL